MFLTNWRKLSARSSKSSRHSVRILHGGKFLDNQASKYVQPVNTGGLGSGCCETDARTLPQRPRWRKLFFLMRKFTRTFQYLSGSKRTHSLPLAGAGNREGVPCVEGAAFISGNGTKQPKAALPTRPPRQPTIHAHSARCSISKPLSLQHCIGLRFFGHILSLIRPRLSSPLSGWPGLELGSCSRVVR